MDRAARQTLIRGFRKVQVLAALAETTARGILPQDIGPTSEDRTRELMRLRSEAARVVEGARLILESIDAHIGADAAITQVRYPKKRK